MRCPKCGGIYRKDGVDKNGNQRYRCMNACTFGKRGVETKEESVIDSAELTHDLVNKGVDWRSMFIEADVRASERVDLTGFDRHKSFRFEDSFVDVCFSADWHTFGMNTQHKPIVDLLEYVLETENTYMILDGDLADNFNFGKMIKQVLDQVYNPVEQKLAMTSILKELLKKGKLIASVLGNHEGFDLRSTGESIFSFLDFGNALLGRDRALIRLVVGENEYVLDVSHKPIGKSIHSPQFGNIKNMKQNNPYGDVFVTAHTHNPGYEKQWLHGEEKLFITLGANKLDDDFSWAFWPNGSSPFSPIVRFSGNARDMRLFEHFSEVTHE